MGSWAIYFLLLFYVQKRNLDKVLNLLSMESREHYKADGGTKELLFALRNGDFSVFERVYKQYADKLYIFAQRTVATDTAEDVVQDVFIDLWKRATVIEIRGSLQTYLFGATYRRALNYRRNDRVRSEAIERFGMEGVIDQSMGKTEKTEARLERAEIVEKIWESVEKLPERTRLVLALRWNDEMTYNEISQILGISVDAAKKQAQRAEKHLRDVLGFIR